MRENAICLITIKPNIIWIDFLSKFQSYEVYIVLDDIDSDVKLFEDKYPSIHFIKITNEECINTGYIHSSYMPTSSLQFNEIIAWDRALYYFTNIGGKHEHIWFLEDDCFFYDENTLLNIDGKHYFADLLCKDKNPEPKENEWLWFWPAIKIYFPQPYFHSPICAVRLSNRMLFYLNEYVKQHKKLFFIEAMFPSIAHRNYLNYELCEELDQLHWRRNWNIDEFNKIKVFHPIKNMEEQMKIRCLL